ncbi:conserved hypothetical protein [Talaromyces stipitatus ATCC 10500]|uniref:Thioesterase n=1 Tax=Talaromyces stipitatus (strain ATCC 10500 / CBS 375.48 / QM 6759 / NRRL 1006) TaxID=441959 RepID=B8MQ40_TALSN|nr:uncharacterized protein TSTA_055680 [Talaromyces stipitatus ATCC 10500]EED13066.1 conserved hypothetical protein [Talaromyces stipitatus ATCC 10500]
MNFSLFERKQWPPSWFTSGSHSMPGVWAWRVLSTFRASFKAQLRQTVRSPSADNKSRRLAIVTKASSSSSIKEHPLFQPTVYSTHAPLTEIDINLHKSNSTYFIDLDVSRAELMGRLLAPAWPMDNMLIEYTGRDGVQKREKVQGSPAFILGATYTSFKREIGAYTSYNVESLVLGWDTRWLYIGSWFVDRKDKKKLYACSLSKYILKKGRITVRPDLFLMEAGWIPSQEPGNGAIGDSWTWDEIEAQRKQGMAIVDSWGDTDLRLERVYLADAK